MTENCNVRGKKFFFSYLSLLHVKHVIKTIFLLISVIDFKIMPIIT